MLYEIFDKNSLAPFVGTICYAISSMIVTVFQIVARYWRLITGSTRCVSKLQTLQVVLIFVNFLHQCVQMLIVFDVVGFKSSESIAFTLAILATIGWIYYASIVLYISLQYFQHSQQPITSRRYLVDFLPYKNAKQKADFRTDIDYSIVNPQTDIDIGSSSSEDSSDSDCSICLDKFQHTGIICQLKCKHYFHLDCIHDWLQKIEPKDYKCPLCNSLMQRV